MFQDVVSTRQIDGGSTFEANASISGGPRVLENRVQRLPEPLVRPIRRIADTREKRFVQGLAIIQTPVLDEAAFFGQPNLCLEPEVDRMLYLCCGPDFAPLARAEPNVKGRFEENALLVFPSPPAGHLARKQLLGRDTATGGRRLSLAKIETSFRLEFVQCWGLTCGLQNGHSYCGRFARDIFGRVCGVVGGSRGSRMASQSMGSTTVSSQLPRECCCCGSNPVEAMESGRRVHCAHCGIT